MMHLTSVLLPAPFSPSSAWTVPRSSVSETSSSARTDPNGLDDAGRLQRGRHGQRDGLDGVRTGDAHFATRSSAGCPASARSRELVAMMIASVST